MQVIYDNTRPAPVGSLMRVGSWDGAIIAGAPIITYALIAGVVWYFFMRK